MDYWQGRCPLTGISDPALLRASHIVPWAECETDAQRLDVHNGLLLAALLRERSAVSVAEAVEATGANRHTLKDKFGELVETGVAELHGKGRGAHYRPAR